MARKSKYEFNNRTAKEARTMATEKVKSESLKAIKKLNTNVTLGGKPITPETIQVDYQILKDDLNIHSWGEIKRKRLANDFVERYDNPISVAIAFNEYVEWSKRTPFKTKEMIKSGLAAGEEFERTTYRPLTLEMFLAKTGMNKRIWERKKQLEGFQDVCESIEQLIAANQIEGGMVGIYDSSLVARLNRIGDNVTVTKENAIKVELSVNGITLGKEL